jgi:hypothetical protein
MLLRRTLIMICALALLPAALATSGCATAGAGERRCPHGKDCPPCPPCKKCPKGC